MKYAGYSPPSTNVIHQPLTSGAAEIELKTENSAATQSHRIAASLISSHLLIRSHKKRAVVLRECTNVRAMSRDCRFASLFLATHHCSSLKLATMGWFQSVKHSREEDKTAFRLEDYISVTPKVQEQIRELQSLTWSQATVAGAAVTVSFLLGFKAGRIQPSWRRITTVADISPSDIGPNSKFLRGRVLSVSDGDTFRFLHVPTIFHSSTLKEGEKLSETALAVRICTIDTPETAKFGKPGQAFGDEAKNHLQTMLLDKTCRIRLLQKDQYGRAVAEVRKGFWPLFKYMDEEMIKAGLAEIYLGGGAVYGFRGLDAYTQMMEKAKNSKKGMWSLGSERESAAEFKARLKAET